MKRMLIVGGGIGGLTLLRAMRDMDWCIDVVERAQTFKPLGLGIVIYPNGMRVMEALGLSEAILQAGQILTAMELVRAKSTLQISLPELWRGMGQPTISILRPALHSILLQEGGIQTNIQMSCALESVDFSYPCAVARFENGVTKEYDLIVGADGVHSVVRRTLGLRTTALSTDLYYFRFLADNVIDMPNHIWRTHEKLGYSFGFIPVSPRRLHCFLQLHTTEDPCAPGQEMNEVVRRINTLAPSLQPLWVARCGSVHGDFARMVQTVEWGHNQCVLLGDAAHALSPTLSEGGSLAMEDALVLALALRGENDLSLALHLYRQTRHQRVTWAYRMALAQVNAARRRRAPGSLIDGKAAIQHMAQMYSPLKESPLPLGSGVEAGSIPYQDGTRLDAGQREWQ